MMIEIGEPAGQSLWLQCDPPPRLCLQKAVQQQREHPPQHLSCGCNHGDKLLPLRMTDRHGLVTQLRWASGRGGRPWSRVERRPMLAKLASVPPPPPSCTYAAMSNLSIIYG